MTRSGSFAAVIIAVLRDLHRELDGFTPQNRSEAARMAQERVNAIRGHLQAPRDDSRAYGPPEPPNVPFGSAPSEWWTV